MVWPISMIKSLFSKKPLNQPLDVDIVVIEVKTRIQELTKIQDQVNTDVTSLRDKAKEYMAHNNKTQAEYSLKQRNQKINHLKFLNSQLLTLQQQYQNLTQQIQLKNQLQVLQIANQLSQQLQKEFDLDSYKQQIIQVKQDQEMVENLANMTDYIQVDLDEEMKLLQLEIAAEANVPLIPQASYTVQLNRSQNYNNQNSNPNSPQLSSQKRTKVYQ
ncbi:Hypothetical_protein [Hexamita inflata]|uniref:Hypothetical_protein n=1 Tax=Hexamita inflata TaxID=28002 RepID=A0AA86QTW6_9EUKA|nr:Hypothetical protein HINF_LOCUS52265 [Hexamita inflata]